MQGGMRLAWVLFSVLSLAACPLAQAASGVIVEAVAPDSPAAKAGILVGDRLLTYDGKPLLSPFALQAAQENTFGKETALLRLERGGQVVEIAVPLGTLGGQVRPDLSPDALRLYQEGRAALEAGDPEEGIAKLTAAAEAAGDQAQAALLRFCVAQVLYQQHSYRGACEACERAWEPLREGDDLAARSRVSRALGLCHRDLEDLASAAQWLQQAWDLDQAAGCPMWAAEDLFQLGNVAYLARDLGAAEDYFTRALAVQEQLSPNSFAVADTLNNLGVLARHRGDLGAAEGYYKRALALEEQLAPDSLAVVDSLNSLGLVAEQRRDLGVAEDYYRRALAIQERLTPDSLAVCVDLSNLGDVARDRGDLEAAEGYFSRALAVSGRLAPDSLPMAVVLARLGDLAADRQQLDAAEDYHQRALAIRERLASDSLDVAHSLNDLGAVAGDRGDLKAAGDYFRRALAVKERLAPDSLDVATTLNNLGGVARHRGDLDAAANYFGRALTICDRLAPGSLDVADSLNGLGVVAYDRGDLDAAEDYCRRALALRERLAPDSLDAADCLTNLGNVAYTRGDLDAAKDYHTRALALREHLAPESLPVAGSLCNLGVVALDQRNLEAADGYLNRALAIQQRLAPDSAGTATILTDLGCLAFRRGDLDASRESFERALAKRQPLAPDSLGAADSLAGLGLVAHERGDHAAAEDYHSHALAIYERLAPDSLELASSLGYLGFCRLAQARLTDAVALFTRAAGILENQRARMPSSEARALLASQHTDIYTGLVRTYVGLRDVGAAFATLERARARGLVELLRERRMDFGGDVPAELLARQEKVQQARAAAYKRLGELAPNRDGDQIQTLRSQLVQYAVQQRELEAEVRRSSPKYADLQYPQPLDAEGARAALDPGTLLLAYSVDAEETYLFAVVASRGDKPDAPASQGTAPEPQHEGLQLYRIPVKDTELGERVRAFRAALTGESQALRAELATVEERPVRDAKAAVTQGKELYDLLVRPAQALVDQAERVLICPDWLLNSVPFAALVVEDGADGVRYFADVKPLHTIVSMTVYAQLRKQAQPAQTTATEQPVLLAFGDPVYGAREPDAAQTERRGGDALRRRVLTPLPGTRDEVEAIGKLYGAEPLLGPQATETAAKQEGRKAPILHFACHGLLDDLDPLASGLALTASEADDGLLRAWEIFESVRLDADLVVLSACETGLGQTTASEGVVGLTRALQYAGARSVLVSLWSVSDASTAALMTAFYRELRAGASKDVALQRAMAEVRNDPNNPRWQHPFHWAPFVLVGDWQ